MISFNRIATLGAMLLFFLVTPVQAASYQEYKCHVVSSKKGDQVIFYRWKTADFKLKMAGIPGRQLSDAKGKKYFVKDVRECVLLSEDFSSEESQRIDERTLR
ncbi:hypothetical protein TUM4644_32650 [Shewanella colwelliana]|uniref:Uncharacterized protein n=2 Tax=Shewanella colwelliana TaxID=23 RepID=A0ABQ4P317_SHECO|nr:TapY2 family type IVa secretion system protein [Shewanella colwelliana]MDX1280575.1 TapY2 family type IVa secretion system protein [Shewanella colwelliana]GIU32495.1 hypothetical protein TUM4644_32650 [Shewanella colwelliana]GIU41916.1 hypothetical protein TUM3794_24030 [Shewanella colwelliana]